MRKILIPLAATLALVTAPAFAQGSGTSGDIGGANTISTGQQVSGGNDTKGDAAAPKKMKSKKKTAKKM